MKYSTMKYGLIWVCITLLLPLFIGADDAPIHLRASLSSSTVTLGQAVSYTVRISGANVPSNPNLKPPQFSPYFIVRNTQKSESFSFDSQSSIQRSIHVEFILVPKKTGSISLTPSSLILKGKHYRSNTVQLKIIGSKQQDNSKSTGSSSAIQTPSKHDVFSLSSLDKKTVFVGEQVTYTLELYRRIRLFSEIQHSVPSFTGFLSNSLSISPHSYVKLFSGKQFHGQFIYRAALFPLDPGKKIISPSKISVIVNSFDGQQLFQSKSLTLSVKPLPKHNRPPQFSGAVGDYTLKGHLDRKDALVGEPITYTIELNGQGNLKAINTLQFTPLPSLKIYASDIKDDISYVNRVKGTRTFEYVVIPKQPGSHLVPTFSLSYFSPKDARYHHLFLPSQTINAITGDSPVGSLSDPINSTNTGLRDLKPIISLDAKTQYPWHTLFGQLLLFINILGLFTLLFLKLKPLLYQPDIHLLNSKRAYSTAVNSLSSIEKLVAAHGKTHGETISHLYKLLFSYLSDKMNHSFHGLTQDKIREHMASYPFRSDQIDALISLINEISEIAYSPIPLTDDHISQFIQKTKETLSFLEQHS
jgi:hypothetical protein